MTDNCDTDDEHRRQGAKEMPPTRTMNGLSRKPLLVLVNPHSGRGKSFAMFNKYILPILRANNIDYEIFVTERDYRLKDYLTELNLDQLTKFKSILVVSGDGLLHETINALMSRSDWRQAVEIPLGIVPTGSGNGMAYTLLKKLQPDVSDQAQAIQLCCEQAIQDRTCYSDMVKVTYNADSTIWSFLSIGWGLMSDIDVDSDWLRPLGEWRFVIYGLIRSITSRSYSGKLSYKPAKTEHLMENKTAEDTPLTTNGRLHEDSSDGWVHFEDKFACIYAVHQSHISRKTHFAPKSTLTDQLMYLTIVRGKLSPCRVIEFLLAIDDGSHEELSYVEVVPVTSFILEPLEASKVVVDGEIIPWKVSDGPISAQVVPNIMKLAWTTPDN